MRRGFVFFFASMLLFPAGVFAQNRQPVLDGMAQGYSRKEDEFASALVVDVATGKELYAWKADKAWPIASVTKLMSALVAIDRKPQWSRIVSISKKDEVGGGRLRVSVGAQLSLKDVLYSSIVGSANNAAMALARTSGLKPATFISRMNAKAKSLSMQHSSFADPSGMDPKNVSTARDLVKLANAAFGHSVIRKAASTASYSFQIRNRDQKKTILNTNHLLTRDPDVLVIGGKTGYLEESLNNLVVELTGNRGEQKPALLIVVLGSPTKERLFATAKGLAEWAWEAYDWPSARMAIEAAPAK